jgi:hypothetical protein
LCNVVREISFGEAMEDVEDASVEEEEARELDESAAKLIVLEALRGRWELEDEGSGF